MGAELQTSLNAERLPSWDNLSSDYIARLSREVASEHPDWHADLYALDLSAYMVGPALKNQWWVDVPEDGASQYVVPSLNSVNITFGDHSRYLFYPGAARLAAVDTGRSNHHLPHQ
jgi:hypothetical protein